jgi:hypothetical protein
LGRRVRSLRAGGLLDLVPGKPARRLPRLGGQAKAQYQSAARDSRSVWTRIVQSPVCVDGRAARQQRTGDRAGRIRRPIRKLQPVYP